MITASQARELGTMIPVFETKVVAAVCDGVFSLDTALPAWAYEHFSKHATSAGYVLQINQETEEEICFTVSWTGEVPF